MPDTVETRTRIEFEGWFPESYHGSCNGCNRYVNIHGMVPHRVARIVVGGLEFRLCVHCLRVMRATLDTAKETETK